MFLVLLCVVVVCFLLLAHYYVMWNPGASKPPSYRGRLPALPLVGHTLNFLGDEEQLWNTFKHLQNDCLRQGGVVSLYMGLQTTYSKYFCGTYIPSFKTDFLLWDVLALVDPDDCLTVANASLEKHYVYGFGKAWLGNGLMTADVPIWKQHRKLLVPAFSQSMLNGFVGVFNSQARRLAHQLSAEAGNGPFRHGDYLINNALETVAQTTLNLNVDNLKIGDSYVKIMEELMTLFIHRFQKVWMHNPYVYHLTPHRRRRDKLITVLKNVSETIIKNRKLELKQFSNQKINTNGKQGFKSILDMLLELVENNALTDTDIREELDTMIVAGYDTSSTILTYVLLLLGSHPNVQERAYNEIQKVLGNLDRELAKEDFTKFTYLEAVIKETMRLYPIGPIIPRIIDKDLKLKNYTLPAGSTCVVMVYGLHHHPVWGSDVEEFKPERWLDPGAIPDNPITFSPFGIGRRSCIGRVYGMMSLKANLVHLLRRYRVISDISKLVVKFDGMLKPSSGHEISIELRS